MENRDTTSLRKEHKVKTFTEEDIKEINEKIKPIIKIDNIKNYEFFELEEFRKIFPESRTTLQYLRSVGWKIKDGRKQANNTNEKYHGIYIRELPGEQIKTLQNMISEVIKED